MDVGRPMSIYLDHCFLRSAEIDIDEAEAPNVTAMQPNSRALYTNGPLLPQTEGLYKEGVRILRLIQSSGKFIPLNKRQGIKICISELTAGTCPLFVDGQCT